jgi:hypothetical protein
LQNSGFVASNGKMHVSQPVGQETARIVQNQPNFAGDSLL